MSDPRHRHAGYDRPGLQRELKRARPGIPIVFITAHADEAFVRSCSNGRHECLFKPFSDTALLDALNAALAREVRVLTLKQIWN